jgi:predicted GIY-YIG superfamily endonuclease
MSPRIDTHCVYILRSLQSPTRSYVGYTSDPYHRLRQHNGEVKGGARKTRNHRPWEMLAVISRFSTHTSALQFEWALQHPAASLAVRSSVRGKPGLATARSVKSKFAVADLMTRLEQWSDEKLLLHFTTDDAKALWISATKEESKSVSTTSAKSSSLSPEHSTFGVSLSTLGPLKSLWLYVEAERLLEAAKRKKKEVSEALKNDKKETRRRAREEKKTIGRTTKTLRETTKMAKLTHPSTKDGIKEYENMIIVTREEDEIVIELSSEEDDDKVIKVDDAVKDDVEDVDFDDNDIVIIDDTFNSEVISLDATDQMYPSPVSSEIISSTTSPILTTRLSSEEKRQQEIQSVGNMNGHVSHVTIIIDDDDDDDDEDDIVEEIEIDNHSSADEGENDDDDTVSNRISSGVHAIDKDENDSLPLPLVDRLRRRLQASPSNLSPYSSSSPCGLCFSPLHSSQKEPYISCNECTTRFHMFCAADHFLSHQRKILSKKTALSSSSLSSSKMTIVPDETPIPCPAVVMISEDGNGAGSKQDRKYRTSSCLSSLVWSRAIVDVTSSSSLLASPSSITAAVSSFPQISGRSTSKRKSLTVLFNKNTLGP